MASVLVIMCILILIIFIQGGLESESQRTPSASRPIPAPCSVKGNTLKETQTLDLKVRLSEGLERINMKNRLDRFNSHCLARQNLGKPVELSEVPADIMEAISDLSSF